MKYDIVTIGDAFEDVLVKPTGLKVKEDRSFASGLAVNFELGEKIPLEEVDYEIGGSACNLSVGLSRLGMNASLITVVGDDTPSEKIIRRLEQESVDTKNIIINKKMKTNFSIIFRLDEGRSIFIFHGLKDYSALRIKKNLNTKWLFLAPVGENADGLIKDVIAQSAEKNTLLAWNPGAIQIKEGVGNFRNLLKHISVLFMNKEEGEKFTNFPIKPSEEQVIKRLQSFGPKIVVITNGRKGATAFDGKNLYKIGALNIHRIDSTGAGDSFAAGFLSKIISESIEIENVDKAVITEALKIGIIDSNSVITQIGAQKGLLTKTEIQKELGSTRLEVSVS